MPLETERTDMDPDCQDFDYEGLLEKYSNQDETNALIEEKSRVLDETYKDVIEKHQSVLRAYSKEKRNKDKLRASLAKQLNVQAWYNEARKNRQAKWRKVQQEITFCMKNESQTILLDDMKQMSTEYESLDSEFDDEALQKKTMQLQKDIQPIIEEEHKYVNILKFAKKGAQELDSGQEEIYTTALLPLSKSINLEKTKNFGSCALLEHGGLKLGNTLHNIDRLRRIVTELEMELQ